MCRETEVDTRKEKDLPILDNWSNEYCENDHYTKAILESQQNPKVPTTFFFIEIKNNIIRFIWSHQRSWIIKCNHVKKKKENNTEGFAILDFKTYNRVIGIK